MQHHSFKKYIHNHPFLWDFYPPILFPQYHYLQLRQVKVTEMFPRQTRQFVSGKIAGRNQKH